MNNKEKDKAYIWHPYTSLESKMENLLITSAKGVYLYTDKGEEIIDAISSWWVNLHGHSNDHINQTVAEQAKKLEHVIFAGFTHEPGIKLAERLLKILPGNQQKIFYSDNGSTAVEVAIKMAFQYWYNKGEERHQMIALEGAFHGDTFGAMAVGERGAFSRPFQPLLFEAVYCPFPHKDQEEKVLHDFEELCLNAKPAAFIYEPLVQGASGMRMYSPEVLNNMLRIARTNGIICIADEVMTGFGRTGKLFASEYMEEKPDIICLSKGITGGYLPMGATACNEKIVSAFSSDDHRKTFFHGHSYTGNPLSCAAAIASLDLLENPACEAQRWMIRDQHLTFAEGLKNLKAVKDARISGTILAIELQIGEQTNYFHSLRDFLYLSFLKKGILLRPLGNIIYILPPYSITLTDLKKIYSAVREIIEKLDNGNPTF